MNVTVTPAHARRFPLAVGQTFYLDMGSYGFPATVTAVPGASSNITLAFSTTPGAASLGAAATWQLLAGTATAIRSNTLAGPVTALRAVCTVAIGAIEVVG